MTRRGRPRSTAALAAILDPEMASLSADEIARRTGIPSRTIRAAREREGIAPPPRERRMMMRLAFQPWEYLAIERAAALVGETPQYYTRSRAVTAARIDVSGDDSPDDD